MLFVSNIKILKGLCKIIPFRNKNRTKKLWWLPWQHGDDFLHQVDRRGSVLSSDVEVCLFVDKVGHVSDVDPDLVPAVRQLLDRQCVVQIPVQSNSS